MLPVTEDADAQQVSGGEPASLTPSVADVDVASAVQQARKGKRSRAVLAVAAIVLTGVGVGFGIHSQQGPSSVANAPAPPPPVAAVPAPAAKPEPAPLAKAKPAPPSEVPQAAAGEAPAGDEPSGEADSAAPAADFASAFAAAPNPNAKSYPEVIVRVSPLGAQIYDGKKLLAQTAAKVSLAAGQKKTLTVHLQGYHSRQVLVDGHSESINIVMLPVGGAKAAQEATPSSAPLERSFVVQSQQQAAAKAAPKPAAKSAPASADILPPL